MSRGLISLDLLAMFCFCDIRAAELTDRGGGVSLEMDFCCGKGVGVFGAPLNYFLFLFFYRHVATCDPHDDFLILLIPSAIVVRHDRRLDTPWEPHSSADLTCTTFWLLFLVFWVTFGA